MSVRNPPNFSVASVTGNHIHLRATDTSNAEAHVWVLEHEVIRVAVLPAGGAFTQPRTWAVAPGLADVPLEGFDRYNDIMGLFSCPPFEIEQHDQEEKENKLLRIRTKRVMLEVSLMGGLSCRWSMRVDDNDHDHDDARWHEVARDRATQAYNFGWWHPTSNKVYHYLARPSRLSGRVERYFGLGERSGDLDRAARRFRMCNIDAMGYDARTSDPLYKHLPFYITHSIECDPSQADDDDPTSNSTSNSAVSAPSRGWAFGLFYDTLADCTFDLGCEIDNYHGPYRYFMAEHGDLDMYFVGGPQVRDVVRRFTWLTGRPAMMPRWSLSYSGSTMSYTDAPDAAVQLRGFLDKCRRHAIPCRSFHLSSGYTSIGDKRCVFTWNRAKFPEPRECTSEFLAAGVHFCANIKPCLLHVHPLLEQVLERRLALMTADGQPAWVQFWSDVGVYLDFTNRDTIAWWKERVTSALLEFGISATWNDNNEFEVWSSDVLADAFGRRTPAVAMRAVMPLLMMRASREAQLEFAPHLRPFVVSRSGMAGMQRYAQTWSGDNSTSWASLRYNIRMGAGLALSGISNTGHDVGGFAGPRPSRQLFLRWVQCGVFMPRFSIHSWNDDGTVNEPWMFDEQCTAHVQRLMVLRERLVPYLYSLQWRYHTHYEPIWRPTLYDFDDDPRCLTNETADELMLGPHLLVASVVQPNATRRAVYLPSHSSSHAPTEWIDFWNGDRFAGRQTVERSATDWDRPVLLARAGAIVPFDLRPDEAFGFGPQPDAKSPAPVHFALFPMQDGCSEGECAEDQDGEATNAPWTIWRLQMRCELDKIHLTLSCDASNSAEPIGREVMFRLPRGEQRAVELGASLRLIRDTGDSEYLVAGAPCRCVSAHWTASE